MTDALASSPMARALGLALLHFVWQGALLGVLTAATLAALDRRAASLRYLAGCAGLVAMLGAPVGTWWAYWSAAESRAAEPASAGMLAPSVSGRILAPADVASADAGASASSRLDAMAPVVAGLWSIGVLVLSVRLLGGCLRVEALRRRATMPLAPEWRIRIASLAGQLGVTRKLRAAESSLVEVPTVIGSLRPLILVPASALAGLSPSQLEAILAHEIAHIRRHDYLVNVLQHVIETLLFYHPAVWWVSRRVRIERELCCDDLAVAVCGDRLTYAGALASLEELRIPTPALGISAAGGDLLSRVRRILDPSPAHGQRSPAWTAIVIVLALALLPALTAGVKGAPPAARADDIGPSLLRLVATPGAAKETRAAAKPGTVDSESRSTAIPSDANLTPGAVESRQAPAPMTAGQPLRVTETVRTSAPRTSSPTPRDIPRAPAGERWSELGYRRPGGEIGFPRVIREEKPSYTAEAMRNRIQGSVELEAVVMENGTVADVRIIRSLDSVYGLDDQAMAAARQWLFEPARNREGVPVPVIVTLVLDFRLGQAASNAPVPFIAPPGARVTAPLKIRHVNPSYPAAAQQASIEGTVVIEAVTDVSGKVVTSRVVRSIPLLDTAAVASIRQWVYTPTLVNDTAVPLAITATFHFSLTDGVASPAAAGTTAPIRVGGAVREPMKIRTVNPVYPQEARDAGIQGMVILEAVIDEGGNVTDAKVIRSVPMLDEAAVNAVRQWKYTPPTLDGVPKAVIMTVTINFTLN